jgi:hypothetical protein
VVGTPRSLLNDLDDGEEWQKMLSDIDASEVPIDMLKLLKTHLSNGTSFIFPIKEWLDAGSDPDEIDEAIIKWYKLKDKEIIGSDFVVNLEKLKETVIPQTKLTLKDLK